MPRDTGRTRSTRKSGRRSSRRSGKTRRGSRKRNYVSTVSKQLATGFPPIYLTKLRYNESIEIDPPANSLVGQYVFRANSIYDPNYTGTGHQPMGRDVFAGLYKNYLVVGAKIRARFQSADNGNEIMAICGITTSADTSITYNDANSVIENGRSGYKFFNYDLASTSRSVTQCSRKWSGKKWFGWKDWRDNHAQYSAPQGSQPNEIVYFILFVGDTAPANLVNLAACRVNVTIDYIVAFTEQIEQSQN